MNKGRARGLTVTGVLVCVPWVLVFRIGRVHPLESDSRHAEFVNPLSQVLGILFCAIFAVDAEIVSHAVKVPERRGILTRSVYGHEPDDANTESFDCGEMALEGLEGSFGGVGAKVEFVYGEVVRTGGSGGRQRPGVSRKLCPHQKRSNHRQSGQGVLTRRAGIKSHRKVSWLMVLFGGLERYKKRRPV